MIQVRGARAEASEGNDRAAAGGPPRRLLLGPFAALEEAFVAAVRELRRRAGLRPVPVLVTSNLLRAHLRRRLAESGGAVNVRFLLVPDLARRLAPDGDELPPQLADLVLEGLLEERVDLAAPYAAIAARAGLRAALLGAFRDLAEAAIDPAELARGIAALVGDGPARRRLETVGAIYAAHRQRLAALGLVDPSERVERAARAAASSPWLGDAAAALVYGFYDLSEVQLALVEGLAARLETTVFFPWLDTPAFAFARPTLAALAGRGFVAEPVPAPPASRPAALAALEQRLFAGAARAGAVGDDGSVRIVSCPGESREMVEVARRLAALARSDPGLAFERVAILARNLRPLRPALDVALEQVQVAAALPRTLDATRPGRVLRAVVAARRSDLGRREVLDLIDLAEGPAWGDDRSRAGWDRLSREAGIVAGAGEWQRRLRAVAARGDGGRAGQARRLGRAVTEIQALLDRLPSRAMPSRFAVAARAALEALVPPGEERERAAALLDPIAALDAAGRPVTLARFDALLATALGNAPAPPGEERPLRRGVLVADLMAARGVPFDVVVVPGLAERGFPAPAREDPVLLDADRLALGRALGRPGALAVRAGRLDEERLLFALAAGAARQRLVLTWPRLEVASARERLPSSFLLAVAAALSGRRADHDSLDALGCAERVPLARLHPGRPEASESELEYDLASADRADPSEVLHLAEESAAFRRGLDTEWSRWLPRLGRHDGVVGPGLDLVAAPLSPSLLEDYAACPLRSFFRHPLGLGRLDQPERITELEPTDRGTIVHRALHSFLDRLRAEGRELEPGDRAELQADLAAAVQAALERHQAVGLVGPESIWRLEGAAIGDDLQRWLAVELAEVAAGGRWRATLLEARFGPLRHPGEPGDEDPASSDEPVRFDAGGRALRVRGRIDRVDVSRDRRSFRVIDYKTGLALGRPERLDGGRALQLPFYLLGARQLLAGLGLRPAAGHAEYFHVSRRGGMKRIRWSETGGDRAGQLRRAVELIVAGMAAGYFQARPSDDRCRRCDFLRICGAARHRLAERKADDPGNRILDRLAEIP